MTMQTTLNHISEHTINAARNLLIFHKAIDQAKYERIIKEQREQVEHSRSVHPTMFHHPLEYYLLPSWEDFILIQQAYPDPDFPERNSPLKNYNGCKSYSVYFHQPQPTVLYLTADTDQEVLNDPVCVDSNSIEVSINHEYQYRYERLQDHNNEFVRVIPIVLTNFNFDVFYINKVKEILQDNKAIVAQFDDGDKISIKHGWNGFMCMYDYAERITVDSDISNGVSSHEPIQIGQAYTHLTTPGGRMLSEKVSYELSEIDQAIHDFYCRVMGKRSTLSIIEKL